MNKIKLMKQIWEEVYDPNLDTDLTIKKHFHTDFEQCINGTVMKRPQYIKHVQAQKLNFILETISYKEHVEKKDELFTAYYVKGTNQDNQPIEAEVIIYVQFHEEKIFKVHGLVMLTKGKEEEIDM